MLDKDLQRVLFALLILFNLVVLFYKLVLHPFHEEEYKMHAYYYDEGDTIIPVRLIKGKKFLYLLDTVYEKTCMPKDSFIIEVDVDCYPVIYLPPSDRIKIVDTIGNIARVEVIFYDTHNKLRLLKGYLPLCVLHDTLPKGFVLRQ